MAQGSITGMTMVRESLAADLPPEQVIGWLRGPEGERWASANFSGVRRHSQEDGIIATVLPAPGSGRPARWPEPFYADYLHGLSHLPGGHPGLPPGPGNG